MSGLLFRGHYVILFSHDVLRVSRGFSVQFTFSQFETETNIDTLRIYEGVGPDKVLTGRRPEHDRTDGL